MLNLDNSTLKIFRIQSSNFLSMGKKGNAVTGQTGRKLTLHAGNFFMKCLQLTFFSKLTFSKNILEMPSDYQTFCISIRLNILSDLILVQTVCKDYQKTALAD